MSCLVWGYRIRTAFLLSLAQRSEAAAQVEDAQGLASQPSCLTAAAGKSSSPASVDDIAFRGRGDSSLDTGSWMSPPPLWLKLFPLPWGESPGVQVKHRRNRPGSSFSPASASGAPSLGCPRQDCQSHPFAPPSRFPTFPGHAVLGSSKAL